MKKILLLTKINPIEIYDVMMHLYNEMGVKDGALFFSPQYVGMLTAEKLNVKFPDVFYSSLRTWHKKRDEMLAEHPEVKMWVTVGTDDSRSKNWYDAIISLDNESIGNYWFDEDWNVDQITYFTTKNGEVKFKDLDEVVVFLTYILKTVKEEN